MVHGRSDYSRIQDPSGKIPEDEPVFLLRAQDSIAAETVAYWADRNRQVGGDPNLSALAQAHVLRMTSWRCRKPADGPPLEDLLHRPWGKLSTEDRARLPIGTRLGTAEPHGFYLEKLRELRWIEVPSPQCTDKRTPQDRPESDIAAGRLVQRLGTPATPSLAPDAKAWEGYGWGDLPLRVQEELPEGTLLHPRFVGGFYLKKERAAPWDWMEVGATGTLPLTTETRTPRRVASASIHLSQRVLRVGPDGASTPAMPMPTPPSILSPEGWVGRFWEDIPFDIRGGLPPGTMLSPAYTGGYCLRKAGPGSWIEVQSTDPSMKTTETRISYGVPEASIKGTQRVLRVGYEGVSTAGACLTDRLAWWVAYLTGLGVPTPVAVELLAPHREVGSGDTRPGLGVPPLPLSTPPTGVVNPSGRAVSPPSDPVTKAASPDRAARLAAAQVLYAFWTADLPCLPAFKEVEDESERRFRASAAEAEWALRRYLQRKGLRTALDPVLPGWFDVDTSDLSLDSPLPFTVHDDPVVWQAALVKASVDPDVAAGLIRVSKPS
jgi:hypothetical protein